MRGLVEAEIPALHRRVTRIYLIVAFACAAFAVVGAAVFFVFQQTAEARQRNFCLLASQSVANASDTDTAVDPALVAIIQGLGCSLPAPVTVGRP